MLVNWHSITRLSQDFFIRGLRITSWIHLPVHAERWPVSALGGRPQRIRILSDNLISNWRCPVISSRKYFVSTAGLWPHYRHWLGKTFSHILSRIMSSDKIRVCRDFLEIGSHFWKMENVLCFCSGYSRCISNGSSNMWWCSAAKPWGG